MEVGTYAFLSGSHPAVCCLAGQEAHHALGPAMASHLFLAHLRLELLLSDLADE